MKDTFNKYGRRISDDEYEKKIIALYTALPPDHSEAEFLQTRKTETNLKIDCKLGVDFPAEKREAVWDVIQGLEKKRMRMALKNIFFAAIGKKVDINKQLSGLVDEMLEKTGKTLDKEDMERFFGPENERSLPPVPD